MIRVEVSTDITAIPAVIQFQAPYAAHVETSPTMTDRTEAMVSCITSDALVLVTSPTNPGTTIPADIVTS